MFVTAVCVLFLIKLWWPKKKFPRAFIWFCFVICKQQFLHSDWLRACQLIPNQCKKVK